MQRISAEESRDVGGAGQKIEAALLDRFEIVQANAQRHLDSLDAETARFALITQQTTDGTPRRRLAFHRPPIDLIWHNLQLAPSRNRFSRGLQAGQKRFDFFR